MFHDRIWRLEQISRLEQIIAAMPDYPIYRESEHCYSIYIQGLRHVYTNEAQARISQLRVHAGYAPMIVPTPTGNHARDERSSFSTCECGTSTSESAEQAYIRTERRNELSAFSTAGDQRA